MNLPTTQRTLSCVLATACFLTTILGIAPPAEAASPALKFGIDAGSVQAQTDQGVKPDYMQLWVGPWLERSGWDHVDRQFADAVSRGITPEIQFYYWGSETNLHCYNNGCWGSGYWKDRAHWDGLAANLVSHLKAKMGGRAAVIVLETEFNKNDFARSETIDAALEAKAKYFRANYPPSEVVLGFGNWGRDAWGVFDRAAAASTYVGLQGMRAPTRDTLSAYTGVVGELVAGAQELQRRFQKPVFIDDFAVSSYWEPEYLTHQATVIRGVFQKLPELKAAGVIAFVYRGLNDNPSATTAEFYGEAERHFGLRWSDGRAKPAFWAYRDGVIAERGSSSTAPSSPTTPTGGQSVPAWGATRVEAERFITRTAGGNVWNSQASASNYWNLWSNGHLSQSFQFAEAGTYEFRVRAQGTHFNGVAPHLVARLDGTAFLWKDPGPYGFHDYVARTWVGPGAHTLKLEFTNDASGGGQDRNLWLDSVQVALAG